DGRAADAACDSHLVHTERSAETGAHDFERMSTDRNRNRTWTSGLIGALCKQAHVVGRDDIDARKIPLLDHETIHSRVEAELRVSRNDGTCCDHRTAVVDGRHRYRKPEEIDRVADFNDFLVLRGLDVFGFDRMFDAVLQLVLNLTVCLAAHRHNGPRPR